MFVDTDDFVHAMSRVPGPVTVVTTVDLDGRRWGFTASSFVSLSLDPPLVLICLDKGASTHTTFVTTGQFMVNVLAHGQADVARRFSRSGVDRFAAGDAQPCELGLPGIPSAAVRVACSTYDVFDGGDHSIILGLVESVHANDRAALAYCNRTFGRMALAERKSSGRRPPRATTEAPVSVLSPIRAVAT